MSKLSCWHEQTAARLARVEAILMEGIEEEVAELVQTVAVTVKLNADGSMDQMALKSLATRTHSADPVSRSSALRGAIYNDTVCVCV